MERDLRSPSGIERKAVMLKAVGDNLSRVRERISTACLKYGRETSDVRLVAVSKTKPVDFIYVAMEEGQMEFGENYVQDALAKIVVLPQATWHFIGNIQSNKTQQIANNFEWVHSLASVKVAKRLSRQREKRAPLNVLVQVNVSKDPKKTGIEADNVSQMLEEIQGLENLKLRGLMTITENTKEQNKQRRHFARLSRLLEELNCQYSLSDFNQLSMGMTQDLELAIAEGATIVRVGTDIFGARET